MGWPTAREGHGHGVLIVVVGVTTHQGGREIRHQGEGAQVATGKAQGGRRNAYSHNCAAPTHACRGSAALESVLQRKVPGAFGERRATRGCKHSCWGRTRGTQPEVLPSVPYQDMRPG